MKNILKAILIFAIMFNCTIFANYSVYAECSHVFGEYIITQNAGCTTTGSKYRVCKKCGYKSTVMIYPKGHNTKSKVVLPKCTAKGYTLAYCTVSGCDYTVKYNYTDALGHNTKDTCVTPPDCTTQGKRKIYCTRCSFVTYLPIPAHGHIYNSVNENVCAKCGYKKPMTNWSYMFKSPYMATHISQRYPNYDNGEYHKGIDIIDANGDVDGYPVYASYDGYVKEVGNNASDDRGIYVQIVQDNGYVVRYLHMQKGSVKITENDKIKAGDYVGKVGCTGYAFGSHLHYDVKKSLDAVNYTQPLDFFKNINFTYSY